MAHTRDLREFVSYLEGRGKLYRFTEKINKDTELYPLYRIQMRGLPEAERKVFLFEHVTGAKGLSYDMSVLTGIYGTSEEILVEGIGCESFLEVQERWHEALTNPLAPVLVDQGPVQQEIHLEDEIQQLGLDEFPAPVEEPGFSGMIRTGVPMITKDPETGVRNVGTYNGFFRARDRIVAAMGQGSHALSYHWQTARRLKQDLPVAIVIGCNPALILVGSTRIPYGTDELSVAGGLTGAPVELVRCRTVPLEVPAHAEAVIEGVISTELVEPRLPFGEYPGYLQVDYNVRPVMRVTAVTHRKKAMFTPVLVGFPPNDTNFIQSVGSSAQMYHQLKYESHLLVEEVYYHEMAYNSFCLIRVANGISREDVGKILQEVAKRVRAKYTILVDSDINLRDPDVLIWALSFRTQPKEDFTILPGGSGGLDPSASPPGAGRGKMGSAGGREYSRVLIDATRKWPYPPVALPRRDYMERALQIWDRHKELPTPQLREPWYGYALGNWDEKLQEFANLITRGEYLKVGEEMATHQEKVMEGMMAPSVRR